METLPKKGTKLKNMTFEQLKTVAKLNKTTEYGILVVDTPHDQSRGILATRQAYWLTSPFLVGRSASYGCAITPPRAEHIVL